jgi:hypothetical protein
LVSVKPDRFGHFATLPLSDVDEALAEAADAFDTLKADVIVVVSNYENHYLGDPVFEPLWQELNQRSAWSSCIPASH